MEVKVPDIGDFKDVPVITVLVSVGDTVAMEDPLIELESDKATMEVPSPAAGVVKEIRVKEGDKVSEGSAILVLEGAQTGEGGAGQSLQAASHQPAIGPLEAHAVGEGGNGDETERVVEEAAMVFGKGAVSGEIAE